MDRPHPLLAVKALADAEGMALGLIDASERGVVRLVCDARRLAFKLSGDPGSALDRQALYYHDHFALEPGTPEHLLAQIRKHQKDRDDRPPQR